MKNLDRAQALALLATLPVVRLAGFDIERGACYAVPLAFAIEGEAVLIAISAGGRLARLLETQRAGLCLEADDVRPDLSFRSLIGTVQAQPCPEGPALSALAARYGGDWGRWRPGGPLRTLRLVFSDLQGRDST